MNEVREAAKLIEVLHLAFLQVLPSYLPVSDYIVKGGANLRLFYDSRRRSQDIDLDYVGRSDHVVEEKVDSALAAKAFRDFLRVGRVTMSEPTKPKQTPATRRWKFSVAGGGAFLNTKIEFSGRSPVSPEHRFEAARSDLGRHLGLRAVRAEHYLPAAAIGQKIDALAGRSQTEPRDIFDLDLLFSKFPDAVASGEIDRATLDTAITVAMLVPFEAYQDLVIDFIEEEHVEILDRDEVWDEMRLTVVDKLESLR